MPGLVTILVGDNPASVSYVRLKIETANQLGFKEVQINLPTDISEADLLFLVNKYNGDDTIHGILVQLPLPTRISGERVINAIDPNKDVDGFHPVNMGLLLAGRPAFEPATPLGILELLQRSGHSPSGKEIVVLGRGFLVGRPLAVMLSLKSKRANATVTVCHTGTRDISAHTKRADIIVAAIGRARFLTGDMVKPGAVVIDVGTNQINDPSHPKGKRLVGDVDFGSVKNVAGAITPVPGGVGPMTIAMLMQNTLRSLKLRLGIA